MGTDGASAASGIDPPGRRGRLSRPPFPRLLVTSLVVLVPAVILSALNRAPIDPDCFEYCAVGRDLAGIGLVLVGELWLLAVLLIAWDWRSREPAVAAVAVIAAAPCLAAVTAGLYRVVGDDVINGPMLSLAWVLGLGLQLPGVWRLAARTPSSLPLRGIVAIMHIAVIGAALAILLFGTSQAWSAGPQVVALAWALFVACIILITAAAWLDDVEAPIQVGPLLGASLLILLLPIGLARPGAIGYVIFLAIPLTALAWLWIARGWVQAGRDRASTP